MKTKACYIILYLFLFQQSCTQQQSTEQPLNGFPPKIVEASQPTVYKKNHAVAKVLTVHTEVKAAGKPEITILPSNVSKAGAPVIRAASKPIISQPGTDTFKLPSVVPAIHKPVLAGQPEEVQAKEAKRSDNNPAGFSAFTILEGLKSEIIFPVIQDKAGNIWIATFEGGVCKYDGRSFTNYSSAQGLSDDHVWSMMEDSKGNMWFGMVNPKGVDKFDGKSFTHFTMSEGLSGNNVISMLEDSKGNLWFGTRTGGVDKYDGKTFTHYTTAQGLINNYVTSMIEDKTGNLWFGTVGGLSRFNGNAFYNYTVENGLFENDINSLMLDKKGNIWIGSHYSGVVIFDGKYFSAFSIPQGLNAQLVAKTMEDNLGNIWLATNNGAYKYDGVSFTRYGIEEGLNCNRFNSIFQDKSGNIWFGRDCGGICKYDGGLFTHYTIYQITQSRNDIRSIMLSRTGDTWATTGSGALLRLTGQSVLSYGLKQGVAHDNLWQIFEDKQGDIWIGLWGKGIQKFNGKSFTLYSFKNDRDLITGITQDKQGNMWFSSYGGLMKFNGKTFTGFDTDNGLPGVLLTSILTDKNGSIWMGTYGNGLIKCDSNFIWNYTAKHGLNSDNIYSIYEDTSGNIWAGTFESGVNKFDGKSFTQYTTLQGLSNNRVNCTLQDNNGNIWFLTSNGLCKMEAFERNTSAQDNNKPLIKSFLKADGFLGVGTTYTQTLMLNPAGSLWAATADRITAYHPEFDIPDSIPPVMQLTGVLPFSQQINWAEVNKTKDTSFVLANGIILHDVKFEDLSKWYSIPTSLSLAYDNNYLEFQFTGIATRAVSHIKYQYIVDGLDDKWSLLTDKPQAIYNNLPPGNYIFKVKAINSDGYWSKEFHYAFSITPPWYKRAWFFITILVISSGLFYTLIRWRVHQKFRSKLQATQTESELAQACQRSAELQQKTTELEMQALRAQMNPHFIFNSLNAINRFILQNNKAQASGYLTKFSRLIRLILQNSQAALITLQNELEALSLYLQLEALRFENAFEYTITIADEVDAETIKVPPLIIQPYAENAIWHGLMHLPAGEAGKAEKGHLEIEIYQQDDDILCCKIRDDGIGRKKAGEVKSKSAATHKAMGMQITAGRLAILQQEKQPHTAITITDVVLADGSAGGTEVLLKIPVQYD